MDWVTPLPPISEASRNPSPSTPTQACLEDGNEQFTLKSPHHSGRRSFSWKGLLGSYKGEDSRYAGPRALWGEAAVMASLTTRSLPN